MAAERKLINLRAIENNIIGIRSIERKMRSLFLWTVFFHAGTHYITSDDLCVFFKLFLTKNRSEEGMRPWGEMGGGGNKGGEGVIFHPITLYPSPLLSSHTMFQQYG